MEDSLNECAGQNSDCYSLLSMLEISRANCPGISLIPGYFGAIHARVWQSQTDASIR